jgi:hypothetical protein
MKPHERQARRALDLYETHLYCWNSPWLGALLGVPSKHHRLLYSLQSTLRMAEHMRGHAKGRKLRKRVLERIRKLDAETRKRFSIALGIEETPKDPRLDR